MSALVWIAIGLLTGALASWSLAGSFGIVADLVLGVVGAFVGGVVFRTLHLRVPFDGLAARIFVALVGAVLLLLLARVLRRGSPRLP